MRRHYAKKIDPKQLAFIVGITVAIISFFATLIALVNPNFPTITKFLELSYGTIGYSVSTLGLILGTVYSFADAFVLIWIITWGHNKIVKHLS